MRFITLASAERRARRPFNLTDITGRRKFGTMIWNQSTGRHEMVLPEDVFLQHAKDLALVGRLPGCCVFVGAISETKPDELKPDQPREHTSTAAVHAPASDTPDSTAPKTSTLDLATRPVVEEVASEPVKKTPPWFELITMAKAAGIDPEDFHGQEHKSAKLYAAVLEKQKLATV